jgi:hypothetical protein
VLDNLRPCPLRDTLSHGAVCVGWQGEWRRTHLLLSAGGAGCRCLMGRALSDGTPLSAALGREAGCGAGLWLGGPPGVVFACSRCGAQVGMACLIISRSVLSTVPTATLLRLAISSCNCSSIPLTLPCRGCGQTDDARDVPWRASHCRREAQDRCDVAAGHSRYGGQTDRACVDDRTVVFSRSASRPRGVARSGASIPTV